MSKVIYIIENTINCKVYVGSTSKFKERKINHLSKLRKNKHPNILLQDSWNSYEESNFNFRIVYRVLEHEDVIKKEIEFVEKYNSLDKRFGFNIKDPFHSDFEVFQYTKKGVFVQKFDNCILAAESLGKQKVAATHIRSASRGNRKSAYGYIWGTCHEIAIENFNKSKKHGLSIPVYQYDLDMNFVKKHLSTTDAANEVGVSPSSIQNVLSGRKKSSAGFLWKRDEYEDDEILNSTI